METETMTVPNNMVNRIARERLALHKIYDVLSTDHSVQMNTEKLLSSIGGNFADFSRYVQTLANEGIIVRETQYQKGYRKGRVSYWKLGFPKEKAIEMLDQIHGREIAKANEAPTPKNSIKNRIMRALEEKGEFATAIDLCDYINKNGEMHVLPHKLTHILHDIATETGQLSFDKTKIIPNNYKGRRLRKSNGTVVVNIVWRAKNGKKAEPVVAQIDDPEPMLISPTPETADFSLIKSFIEKSSQLNSLADEAAKLGQDDVAVMLWERAEVKDPFYLEVIALWHAYQECKNG